MARGRYIKNIGMDLDSGDYRVALYDSGYAPDLDNDSSLDDVPGSAVIADEALASRTFVDGVFDADDTTFAAPPSGKVPAGFVVYRDDVSPKKLVWNEDDLSKYVGFGTLTTGADLLLAYPNDANKIFKGRNV